MLAMFRVLVRSILVFMFAVVFPSQAFVQVEISPNNEYTQPQTNHAAFESEFQAELNRVLSSPNSLHIGDTPPISIDLHRRPIHANVNQIRWTYTPRDQETIDDLGFDSHNRDDLPQYQFTLSSLKSMPAFAWYSKIILSNYRISGWKESNAFYVALNSQYSSSSI